MEVTVVTAAIASAEEVLVWVIAETAMAAAAAENQELVAVVVAVKTAAAVAWTSWLAVSGVEIAVVAWSFVRQLSPRPCDEPCQAGSFVRQLSPHPCGEPCRARSHLCSVAGVGESGYPHCIHIDRVSFRLRCHRVQ